ncbi:MAG: acyl--CoA ligase [Rhodobiaceae bacterium]|nr:acyl--CoA ligase [Rhodobiaceae bacterium]
MTETHAMPAGWPAMSIDDAHTLLTTAPDSPFEMAEEVVRGVKLRVWKNAPSSLRELFELSKAHGDLDYLVFEDERVTYETHYRAVAKLAQHLVARGVGKGDRVAIVMRNYPEWSIAFWATVVIGAITVPLNAWLTGQELEYGLADSGSKVAIVDGERGERVRDHLDALKQLEALIVVRPGGPLPDGALLWDDIVAAPGQLASLPDAPLPAIEIEPEDDATIFYTSGTTGKPKGALGTHRNILTNLISLGIAPTRAFLRRGETPPAPDPDAPKRAFLLSVPFFHATGCHSILVPNLAAGGKIVMMYKWDPEEALRLIEKEKIAAFGGVPAMVWQVLESPNFDKYDLSSVESVSYGGAPSAPELVARIKQAFPKVSPGNGYGLTETSSVTTQNSAEDYQNRPSSAGPAVPVCDLKVVDTDNKEVPVGEVGELLIRGPNVVKGYWNKPEATAEAIDADGWFRSGDLVRMDEEGFVYILDRAKDMLIRGGENIYCVEIEDVLYAHPDVMDAAVIGIPHKVLGEEVGGVVQVTDGSSVTEEALQGHVRAQLAAFKVPIKIEIRNEPLPRNANGKILKTQLREEFLATMG